MQWQQQQNQQQQQQPIGVAGIRSLRKDGNRCRKTRPANLGARAPLPPLVFEERGVGVAPAVLLRQAVSHRLVPASKPRSQAQARGSSGGQRGGSWINVPEREQWR